MSAAYTQHRDRTEDNAIKRDERIGMALCDPNISRELYRTLARIVGIAQVEDIREMACKTLLSVEFWTPPQNTNTFSPELDAALSQEF